MAMAEPGTASRSDADARVVDDDRLLDELRGLMVAYADSPHVARVAAVGNAPLAADDARAREIDSAELVLRANSFVLDTPTDAPCLGTKTHVVLLSRNTSITPWVFRDYRRRLYLIMQGGFSTFHRLRGLPDHWPADLGAMPMPNRWVMSRLSDLLLPGREPGSLIPTTGMTAVYLARTLFREAEIIATGFSFLTDRDQTSWRHHFGSTAPVDTRHRIDLEGALLESWIDEGSVRFLQ